ncbi:MAG: YlbF family regulator [Propionicimonas sp.]|nr:YlbF family regulator [Propionicimonas sp.]
MLSPDLRDAALAFSHALRQAPAVADYVAASTALAEDSPAQQIMLALQGPQASYLRTQQAGLTPSQEQVDQLRHAQAAVRGNEVLMNHLRTTNTVKKFLPVVAREISAALGADYASLIAPPSGC